MNTAVRCRRRLSGPLAIGLVALGLLAIPGSAAAATLELTATDVAIGETIQATATLADGVEATGTISFEVFAPGDLSCSNALAPGPSAATVSGDGSYPSGTFTPTVAGDYLWSAHYSGDLNNPSIDLNCVATSTVAKASPSLEGSASSGVLGGTIKDEATLSGAFSPSEEVTFSVYAPDDLGCNSPLETDTAPLAAGTAVSFDFAPQLAGEFRWRAFYPGDANNEPASTPCGAANQFSQVGKATPILAGTATSAVQVGLPINDSVTLSGGLEPSGQLVFRAFGPADPTCAGAAAYEEAVAVDGNDTYSPAGFEKPSAGLYQWTVSYEGDAKNAAVTLPCGSPNQASAVGTLNVTLAANAGGSMVGGLLTATATLGNGAIPGGQLTFKAFGPGDPTCAGAAAFSSTVTIAGNGAYNSAAFSPAEVGTYRWTIAYSGDANHAAASVACGAAASAVIKATPTVVGKVGKRLTVGTKFRDSVVLAGSFVASGTITFQIFGPGTSADRCDRPAFVNTIRVNGNGTYNSDPFVAKQAGRYRFLAVYSGDARNQPAAEPCSAPEQLARVRKRTPKLAPLVSLIGDHQISVRARLSGASSPTGVIAFRLFAPGDRRCSGRPAFTGSLRIKKNGAFSLAQYIATKPGQYRLAVSYSGDPRNAAIRTRCAGAKLITIRD